MVLARKDLINSIVLFIFCALFYFGIADIPIRGVAKTEADFFPKIILGILLVLSLSLFIKSIYTMISLKNKNNKEDEVRKTVKELFTENKKVIFTFLIFTVYIYLLTLIGYFISSILFLFSLYLILIPGKKKIVTGIIGAFVFTLLLYVIFRHGLSVYLPEGKLF